MKKLLGTTLALAMFFPAGANAELLKNFKASGQLDVQTTSARNIADFVTRPTGAGSNPASSENNDRIGDAHTRVIVRGDWDVLDDVHARVTLVKGGENTNRVYGQARESLDDVQTRTLVQEAFVKIDKLFGHLDTTMGRQFYGEAGDLIIYYGPRDNFGLRTNAIDAFRADWSNEHMQVTGIAGRTQDANNLAANTAGAISAGDVDVRGIVVSCTKHENVKPTAYVYNRVTHARNGVGVTAGAPGGASGKNDNLFVAGVKAKVMAGGFSGAVEFAKNFGQDRLTYDGNATGSQNVSYTGHAIKLNAAYKADIQDVAVVNPWGELARGSGDSNHDWAGNRNFQSIATDYRPGAIYGRFDTGAATALGSGTGLTGNNIASNGLNNRMIWGVGVKATPASLNKLTAGVQFYRYAFDRLPTESTGQRRSRNIGAELDVTGEWAHSENVMIKVAVGSFQPGAYIRDTRGANAAVNPAVMASGDVSIKF